MEVIADWVIWNLTNTSKSKYILEEFPFNFVVNVVQQVMIKKCYPNTIHPSLFWTPSSAFNDNGNATSFNSIEIYNTTAELFPGLVYSYMYDTTPHYKLPHATDELQRIWWGKYVSMVRTEGLIEAFQIKTLFITVSWSTYANQLNWDFILRDEGRMKDWMKFNINKWFDLFIHK